MAPDPKTAGVLLAVGLVAGVVNTLAGGGSFLTLSAMIWLGLPPQVANATNRVGVMAQSLTAVAAFRRAGVQSDAPLLPQALAVVGGGIVGATLSAVLDPAVFERVLALTMLAMIGLSLLRPRAWSEVGPPSPWRWPALVFAGAYGGFLQAGVGVLLLPALVVLGGSDPVRANARKVWLVAALTVPALAIFVAMGFVDWLAGAALAVGSAGGGYLGTQLTVGAGAPLIRITLALVVVATAARLLLA
ncbi:MAG: sulfite exporter TauE/SafE family protein [Myxococcales bacterium]|nr:sulfite exporter TauE/SafE family protein [Myxococcales bacterium]